MVMALPESNEAPPGQGLSIAICPGLRLGDGLLFMELANALQSVGFNVVLYHPFLRKLDTLFPSFECRHARAPLSLELLFGEHDFCIINHCIAEDADVLVLAKHVAKFSILFCWGALSWRHPLWRVCRLVRHGSHFNRVLHQFMKHCGVTLTRRSPGLSLVDAIRDFCHHDLGLSANVQLIPHALRDTLRSASHTVVIHPDSSVYKKNWHSGKYLDLAARLESLGYVVVFAVSPDEYSKWHAIIKERFLLTKWCLLEAARHLHAAILFIGSDSGLGHLASLMGTPTVTVFVRKRRYYAWRPGWARSYIAQPLIKINFIKAKHHLRSTLSVSRVFKVCRAALEES